VHTRNNLENRICNLAVGYTSFQVAYSRHDTKKNQVHFKNGVKSTRDRELLKHERLAKLTEVGKLFYVITILSAKNRLRVL